MKTSLKISSGRRLWVVATVMLGLCVLSADVHLPQGKQTAPESESSVPAPKAPGPQFSRSVNLRAVRALKTPVIKYIPEPTDIWKQDFLTGNWGGTRDWLFDHGLDLTFVYWGNFTYNVDGGIKEGSGHSGVVIASLDFHTEKAGLWTGGWIHATGANTHGPVFDDRLVGSLGAPDYNEAYDTTFLFELWYSQTFKNLDLELRVGKIYPWVMLGKNTTSTLFFNGAFNYPGFLAHGLATPYSNAVFGGELFWDPHPCWSFKSGVFDGVGTPLDAGHPSGLNVDFLKGEGVESIYEFQFRPNQIPGSRWMPAEFKLGLQIDTADTPDRFDLASGNLAPRISNFNHAIYFLAEQMIYREAETGPGALRGLTAFWKIEGTPADRNLVEFHTAGGLAYAGLLPGRDRDVVMVGVTHSEISDDFRRGQQAARAPVVSDYELVLETSYVWEIAPWWVVQPGLQHITHPGGSAARPDALVLALSSRIAF